jgi:hypothetical protein
VSIYHWILHWLTYSFSRKWWLISSHVFILFTENNTNNNNTLQFRPAIARRSSVSRDPASHNLLVTSQIHNHHEQKISTRHFDSDIDHDEGIDSAIESQSLSINTPKENIREVKEKKGFFLKKIYIPKKIFIQNPHQQSKKPVRSVHSSSTRRKINRLFNNDSDLESSVPRTITPENSNESGVYSQSGRDIEYDTNGATAARYTKK